MKKLAIKYLIPGLMVFFFLGSCTKDFEEYNTNPNQPGLDQAPPSMLLTQAIESMTDRVHEIFLGHEMGSGWVQHMAKVQYTDEDRYIPRISVINNSWASFYAANGYDVHTILKIANNQGLDNYKAVGLVMQAYITSVITDLWGDVPYNEAWKGSKDEGGIIQPVYDTQESIYRSLIANLDTANTLFKAGVPDIQGDILYDNDLGLWRKFANSLRLRLLMRMSNVDPTFASAGLTQMIGNANYPVFESNDDNAALQYLGSAPNNNPINENRKTRDDHRVSKTLVDYMYTYNNFVDWRIALYAELDDNDDYEGLPNGLTAAKAAAYNGNGLKKTSTIGTYFAEATAPGMLMTYSEVEFIVAEAIMRDLVVGTDSAAESHYMNGIKASYFQHHDALADGLEEDGWADYFLDNGWDGDQDVVEFAFEHYVNNGAHTPDGGDTYIGVPFEAGNELNQIAYEKWVSLFGQGLQAWFEWRRTDYPVLTPAEDGVNGGLIPVRVTYPTDETTRNGVNLGTAIGRQGEDDLNTRVWWDIADYKK